MISPETLQHVPEIITTIGTLGFLMAFTAKQRAAIIERDGGKCRATAQHTCNEEHGLEVDHIIPQRYASEVGIDPDYPENALSKCKNAHDIKHPDRIEARRKYHILKAQGVDSFKVLGEERRKKLNERVIYWNPANDRTDSVMAVKLTQQARKTGWVFPEKPKPRVKPVETQVMAATD